VTAGPPGEQELVLRAQRGDARAFEELVRPHWEVAFRVAYVVTRDAGEAEDAAQEALLDAWRALPRFRPGWPLRPWLLRIVANRARNRRRAAGRRARLSLRAAADPADAVHSPAADETVLSAEERRRLLAVLDELPEEARLVLVCRYLLDLSEEETAAATGVRRGTVKSRTSRALDRLRELYA